MFEHPQDAYNFSLDRQHDHRKSVNNDRLVTIAISGDGSEQPTTAREWLTALTHLKKVRVEVSLVVASPYPNPGQ